MNKPLVTSHISVAEHDVYCLISAALPCVGMRICYNHAYRRHFLKNNKKVILAKGNCSFKTVYSFEWLPRLTNNES